MVAQTQRKLHRIVVVFLGGKAGFQRQFEFFREEMKKLGHIEGRDVLIDGRWAENDAGRLASLAAEAVASKPAVIVTSTSAGIAACKKATASIPIVFLSAFNPVEQGFVVSLARPGGNVTGVIQHSDLTGKIVEVLREALPKVRRVALMTNDTDPAAKFALEPFESAARKLKFDALAVRVSHTKEFERAFKQIAEFKAEALLLANLAFFRTHRDYLIERSTTARLPLLSNLLDTAENGGLLSYGTLFTENISRAAAIVDKILRGARPGDLPVEQPTHFRLIVNLKTAKAIGATLSPAILARADRVIE